MTRTFRIARRVATGTALASVAPLLLMSSSPADQANTTAAQTRTTAAASVPRCTAPGLEAWLGVGAGGAAAGSVSYPLELTNVSGHTCSVFGFPGVSASYGAHQAGTSARWVSGYSVKRTVTLKPGATAHAVLTIADVSDFPSSQCHPVTATDLRVIPPDERSAAVIPFSFQACSAKGPAYLNVQYMQLGTGIPGHPTL
jgi:hypothetical protein